MYRKVGVNISVGSNHLYNDLKSKSNHQQKNDLKSKSKSFFEITRKMISNQIMISNHF